VADGGPLATVRVHAEAFELGLGLVAVVGMRRVTPCHTVAHQKLVEVIAARVAPVGRRASMMSATLSIICDVVQAGSNSSPVVSIVDDRRSLTAMDAFIGRSDANW
jgi:hypothetical protein